MAMFRKAREAFALIGREDYQYESLPNRNCIRILHIEPATATAMVRYSLRVVDLEDSPSYTALSYSWRKGSTIDAFFGLLDGTLKCWLLYFECKWGGLSVLRSYLHPQDATNDEQLATKAEKFWNGVKALTDKPDARSKNITCDGKILRIHPNLFDALSRLGDSRPGDYWIDALCINQEDVCERNAQVQMMGRIYSSATLVVAWLGKLPSSLRIGSARLLDLAKPETDETDLVNPTPLEAVSRILNEPKKTQLISALVYLLTRRWFQRLWVVQEFCLARKVLFILGEHEFDTSTLTSIILYMKGLVDGPLQEILRGFSQVVPLWENLIQSIPEVLSSSEGFRRGKRWTLISWLLVVKGRKATDPRDAIFAGLSLVAPKDLRINRQLQLERMGSNAQTSSSPSPELWESLHADYSTDVFDVLLNLSACILTKYDWRLLFFTTLMWRALPEYSDLAGLPLYQYPSWIPDPSSWTSQSLEPFFMLHNTGDPLPSLICGAQDTPSISSDGSTLFLVGAELDTISQWSPVMGLNTTSYEAIFRLVQWIAHAIPTVYEPNGCSGMKTLAQVLMSGHCVRQQHAQDMDDDSLLVGTCHLIHFTVQEMVAKLNKRQPSGSTAPKDACRTDEQKARLIAAFDSAKEMHPYAPWPTENVDRIVEKVLQPGQPNTSCSNSFDGERDNALQNVSDDPRNETSTSPEYALSAFFARHLLSATPHITSMSVFVTNNGYMGLGPTWLREGDHIFLICDGKAPYIFSHVDDVLRRRAGKIRDQLVTRTWKTSSKRTKALKVDLAAVESRIGVKDGLQLVGEAYVEGVMHGEVAEEMQKRVEKISIV